MSVTLAGMSIDSRLEQPLKADSPMLVTVAGMTVFLHPATSLLVRVSIIALQSSRQSYLVLPLATVMLAKLEQPRNEVERMLVTFSGMVIDARLEQLEKAHPPIFVMLA